MYCVHLDETTKNCLLCAYIDDGGNYVSGRTIAKELCAECYNKIVFLAVENLIN